MNHGILWILVRWGFTEIMELTSSHAQEGIAKQLRPFYRVEKEPDSDWWQNPFSLFMNQPTSDLDSRAAAIVM
jgi:hypothetical protein